MKKRTYKQNCALALASDLLMERWTFLILRELLIQPCRFKELNQWLQGMGTNLLTNRLKELEEDGIIMRSEMGNKRSPYCLTDKGNALEPVVLGLIRWGYQFANYQPDYLHFAHWDLIAMKAFYVTERGTQAVTIQFKCDALNAWVAVSAQGFSHGIGLINQYDYIFEGTIKAFQEAITKSELIHQEKIKHFLSWFEVPTESRHS